MSNQKQSMDESMDEMMIELQKEFLGEALFLLEACEESYLKLEHPECRKAELDQIFRAAHSFKGTGASVGLKDLASFAHVVEDCLSILRVSPNFVNNEIISLLLRSGDAFKERVNQLREGSQAEWHVEELRKEFITMTTQLRNKTTGSNPSTQAPVIQNEEMKSLDESSDFSAHGEEKPSPITPAENDEVPAKTNRSQIAATIKIDADRIGSVLDMIGELVVTKSQLSQTYKSMNIRNSEYDSIMALMDKSIRELQDRAMGMRMTSLKPLFLRIQRAVRDLSVKLSKPVEFVMVGEEVEMDRTMIDLLGDPLVHIARNSIDHGVEKLEKRKELGKPEVARVTLVAKRAGAKIIIEVQDDGGGINQDVVLRKAIEKNVIPPGRDPKLLSEKEIYNLLFAPGFSTAEVISDVSGRGVGLDVVRSNIEKLKGSVEVSSQLGKGSVFRITIPLTAAITDGLLVESFQKQYIIPIDVIRELIRVDANDTTALDKNNQILNVRGSLLPFFSLEQFFQNSSTEDQASTQSTSSNFKALVVNSSMGLSALRIDRVFGQVQVVVKPIPNHASKKAFIAGTAILGDGRVALVLNLDGLIQKKGRQLSKESNVSSTSIKPQ